MNAYRPQQKVMMTISATLMSVLCGCSTITFEQYEQPGEHKTTKRWHHTTLNGIVEISRPLNVEAICQEKAWTTITTERTSPNFWTDLVVQTISMSPVVLYSSWTNKVQCYETPPQHSPVSAQH